jgi:hypothetical protein
MTSSTATRAAEAVYALCLREHAAPFNCIPNSDEILAALAPIIGPLETDLASAMELLAIIEAHGNDPGGDIAKKRCVICTPDLDGRHEYDCPLAGALAAAGRGT